MVTIYKSFIIHMYVQYRAVKYLAKNSPLPLKLQRSQFIEWRLHLCRLTPPVV